MVKTRIAVLMLIAVFAVSGLASSQTTNGSIVGTVKDESGGVMPGTTVSAKNTQTGVSRETVTDTEGRYTLSSLNIGEYEVTATMQGFQPVVHRGISLTIGREAVVDFALALGTLSESVEVTGDAPLVETRSGGLGGVVDRETILQLPLNGRDLTGLITMEAGTTMSTNTSTGASQGYSNKFSIGGARVGDNAVLLDGTDVRSMDGGVPAGVSGNFLGGEAIQEFKVERNSYSAEYGGGAGGVVNVVSKSGGNALHGSVYGFLRDDKLDAMNYFSKINNLTKPQLSRDQYGASAGGHIIQNKMFYFANFEGFRQNKETPTQAQTISAAGRRGDISPLNAPGTKFVNVNPKVVPYFVLYPLPDNAVDVGAGVATFSSNILEPTREYFYQGRVDHNFNQNNSLYVRVTRQTSERSSPAAFQQWQNNNKVYNTFSTSEYKKIVSSSLLNTVRFGLNRRGLADHASEDPATDPSLWMVSSNQWLLGSFGAKPQMGSLLVTGLSEAGLGRGWVDRYVQRWQLTDNAVLTKGRVTWKFGVDYSYIQLYGFNPSRPGGELSFSSLTNFLAGTARQFRGDILPQTDSNRRLYWNNMAEFVQADWQVTSRLTVNLGLRHEFYTVPNEKDGKYANMKDPLTDTTMTVLGTNGDAWWINPSYKDFGPRLGVSWDPTGSGKTAIRGGWGIFQNLIQAETYRQFAWRTAPFALETIYAPRPGVDPAIVWPGDTYGFITGLGAQQGSVFVFPYDDAGNARMHQWNLTVQREIWSNTAITAGYAGSHGLELQNQVYSNVAHADLINGRYVFPANAARPNPAFNQDLASPMNNGQSWYHSGQLEVKRRFQHGWQMQAAYTYARSIDLGSAFTPTFNGSSAGSTIYRWDLNLGKGLSAYDVRQRLSLGGIWQVPGNGLLLGGWQIAGSLNLSDGAPQSITTGARSDLSAIGVGNQSSAEHPDLIAGGDTNPILSDGRDPNKYFDVSQFVFQPPRTLGVVGRNTLIAPGIKQVDLAATKNITFGGGNGKRVQLRVECFNLFNRLNFGTPNTQVFDGSGNRSPTAAQITDLSASPRQVQLGARVEW